MSAKRKFGWVWLLAVLFAGSLRAQVTFSRLPLPPLPPPWLQAWRFDDPDWLNDAELAPLSLSGVEWVTSWSGFALHVTGRGPAVCLLPLEPGLSGNSPGSLRFWFAPDWTSRAAGGNGPGRPATLLQAGETGWRVTTDAAGDTLQVLALGSLPWVGLIEIPISWTAGEWHQLTLTWAPDQPTTLWLDGVAAATGPGLPAAVDDRLWLGGDPTGLLLARGEFDELYTYDHPLETKDIAPNYAAYAAPAALGPVSLAEQHRLQEQIREKLRQARKDRRHPPPPEPFNPGCGLWLAITDLDETQVLLTLYNTVAEKNYRLETSPSYENPDWVFFRNVTGNGSTVTELVDTDDQPMGFFRVVYEPPPMFGFEGLDFATTQIDPPDIAAAVGPDHIMQLLNSKLIIYDKAGISTGPPIELKVFFQATDAVNPRVLYDHRRGRWVASSLERSVPTRRVNVAVSKGSVPTISLTDWLRYTLDFTTPLGDFDTIGMDANGVYFSVHFIDSGRRHAVVALPKDSLYDGTYVPPQPPTWLDVAPPDLTANIIQPAFNFDDTPPDGPAWFVAKGIPAQGPPYKGGAVYFRRLRWVANQAEWLDGTWEAIGDLGNNYQDYFDLDDSTIGAPQRQDDFPGSFDIQISRTGSRLCQPIIRGGFLWVAQHVGLSGSTGVYVGGPGGELVDRSAIQWLKLSINSTGVPLTYSSHGRIFDAAATAPVWYHFPSVAVNSMGDCLFGFSGSGTATYLSAHSAWKPPLSTAADVPVLVKGGLGFCAFDAGADYSSTCVDPSDDLSFWTFQEYANGNEDFEFSTFIKNVLCPR